MTRWRWPALIVLLLGSRLGYVLLSAEGRNPPVADAETYVAMASNIARGDGMHFEGSYSLRPPGYPVFLAGVFKLTGHSLIRAQIVQVFLALATAFLVFKIASFYFDERIAWMTCLIYAISYDAFIIPATFLSENLYAFMLVLSIYLLMKDRYILAAVSLSITCFTRQEAFLLILFVVLMHALRGLRENLKRIAAILAVFFVLESAWAYRNWTIHHKVLLGTTLSEIHLFLSNAYIFQRLGYEGDIDHSKLLRQEKGVTELQMMEKGRKVCADLFERQPLHRLLLAPFLKLGFFLYPFLPGYDLTFMLIFPFWLLGLYLGRHDWRKYYLLYGVFSVVLGLLLVFHAQPRYRGPYCPFMAIFAAACLSDLWTKSLKHRASIVGWALVNVVIGIAGEHARSAVRSLLP
ncbi:MAG: glycosyltransferase family 39 protein [Elusimicrobia bacterium]|nr:glycosyltransferase family 39 protein [Elusimicrobiota bacterium]